MQAYQREFLELAIRRGALSFGTFTLKSGRVSPYFFNIARLCRGDDLLCLGRCYAQVLSGHHVEYDMVYGAAYKGIPLACAVSMALWETQQRSIPWSFSRKETKDHGEGGDVVGAPLAGRVLLVDDVVTAGTAVGVASRVISTAGAQLAAVAIALNRQERGSDADSTVSELEHALRVPVLSIVTLDDLLGYLAGTPELRHHSRALQDYRLQYGV